MDIAELDRDAAVRQDTGPVHAQRWLFRIIDRDHRSIKLAAHTHTAAQPTGKCRAGSTSRAAHTSSGTSISTKNRFSGTVRPSALEGAKLGVYQAMTEQGIKKSELARRLGWHMPQIDRLFDLRHASRLDQIEAAARALGRQLDVRVS